MSFLVKLWSDNLSDLTTRHLHIPSLLAVGTEREIRHKSKTDTIQAAMKKINSIPARYSTHLSKLPFVKLIELTI